MILLVTGNRALGDRPEAALWARRRLAEAMADDQVTAVVHGGARGPDSWAQDQARAIGLRCIVFDGNGMVIDDLRGERAWDVRAERPSQDSRPVQWAAWYLHRDRVMALWVARALGLDVVERVYGRAAT